MFQKLYSSKSPNFRLCYQFGTFYGVYSPALDVNVSRCENWNSYRKNTPKLKKGLIADCIILYDVFLLYDVCLKINGIIVRSWQF